MLTYHNASAGTDDGQIRTEIDVRCVFNDNIKTITSYRFSSLFQVSLLSASVHTKDDVLRGGFSHSGNMGVNQVRQVIKCRRKGQKNCWFCPYIPVIEYQMSSIVFHQFHTLGSAGRSGDSHACAQTRKCNENYQKSIALMEDISHCERRIVKMTLLCSTKWSILKNDYRWSFDLRHDIFIMVNYRAL